MKEPNAVAAEFGFFVSSPASAAGFFSGFAYIPIGSPPLGLFSPPFHRGAPLVLTVAGAHKMWGSRGLKLAREFSARGFLRAPDSVVFLWTRVHVDTGDSGVPVDTGARRTATRASTSFAS